MEPKQSWILSDSNKVLRSICSNLELPLKEPDLSYVNKMKDYIDACYNNDEEKYCIRPGIAIAGPQVGLAKRVIYVNFDFGNEHYQYLLANPRIVSRSLGIVYLSNGEGCLSVEQEHEGIVPRNKKIVVEAYDLLNNKPITINADGVLSICLQHEIDHLDGVLYYDHINKNDKYHVEQNWIKI